MVVPHSPLDGAGTTIAKMALIGVGVGSDVQSQKMRRPGG